MRRNLPFPNVVQSLNRYIASYHHQNAIRHAHFVIHIAVSVIDHLNLCYIYIFSSYMIHVHNHNSTHMASFCENKNDNRTISY